MSNAGADILYIVLVITGSKSKESFVVGVPVPDPGAGFVSYVTLAFFIVKSFPSLLIEDLLICFKKSLDVILYTKVLLSDDASTVSFLSQLHNESVPSVSSIFVIFEISVPLSALTVTVNPPGLPFP